MGHYLSNLRDLEFNLFEVLKIQQRIDETRIDETRIEGRVDEGGVGEARVDEGTVRDVLGELDRLATGPLAESFADGEAPEFEPVFDPVTGAATVPGAIKESYRLLRNGDWHRLMLPDELGGTGLPATVRWAAAELLLGANPALYLYFSAGPACAAMLHRLGTAEQRRWARLMVERDWGATMVITEPDAGSDVGVARTTATRQPDGSWHLEGVKRFITSGDQDLTENIMHMVLARPVGPGSGLPRGPSSQPGVKGLSVFLVPKFLFDPRTGDLGERNGVFATNLEHKMGLRGSTTCELTFGGPRGPARGWLLGETHDGIAQMFQAIEWARMTVGAKAIATLSTGYRNAVAYARTRVQGPDLRNVLDKNAPRVAIIEHPDVRRMLMLQKAYAEGLRALLLYSAAVHDRVDAGEAGLKPVGDLLLPVVKGVAAERCYEQLALSLQVFGGSGYLRDYPIEQYLRDSKIDSLYEGTTAIQSLDFFFRKIVRDGGQAWTALLDGLLDELLDALGLNGPGLDGRSDGGSDTDDAQLVEQRLGEERRLFARAVHDVCVAIEVLRGFLAGAATDHRELLKAGQHTVPLLLAVGDLLVGGLLLRHAGIAIAALEGMPSGPDRAFYEGKVAVASFFARTVLPGLATLRRVVESADNTLMDFSGDAF